MKNDNFKAHDEEMPVDESFEDRIARLDRIRINLENIKNKVQHLVIATKPA